MPPTPEELARFLHESYERVASDEDCETQDKTSVPFDKLPEEDYATMLRVAEAVLDRYRFR